MYSLEERKKAVELYIKYGRKAAYVIRDLGYPKNTKSIVSWAKELEQTGSLHEKVASSRAYTDEEKQKAVAFYLDHGKQISYTIRSLGYPCREKLMEWIDELAPGKRIIHEGCLMRDKHPSMEKKTECVVKLAMRSGSAGEAAKEAGVSRSSLYTWKKELVNDINIPMINGKTNDTGAPIIINSVEEAKEIIARYEKSIEELTEKNKELEERRHRAEIELACLEKAAELLKKDQGISLERLTNKEKALVIDALRERFQLKELLPVFSISKSSYCYCSKAIRNDRHADLRKRIRQLFEENDGRYGYRRIHCLLQREGVCVSEKVVRRLMKEERLVVIFVKRKRYSSYKGEISSEVPNLLQRDFHADKPNQKLLTDITEFSIPAGKVYLSPLVDCYDGMVISWSLGTSPSAELANSMLRNGIALLGEDDKPVVHSDRGCHYRWPEWIEIMDTAGLTRSMSKKGCSPDNSACEGFFGRLKNEMFYKKDWKGVSTEDFIAKVDDYIHWYNEKRIKMSLGGLSPLEFRLKNKEDKSIA